MVEATYDSFGRVNRVPRTAIDQSALATRMQRARKASLLPFGNGRSYGDSCHNDGAVLVDFRSASRILSFNAAAGIIECEAGVMLHEIIDYCGPLGWFLPVTPGTRFVTIGGAIANDVHGKNHHRRGTLGKHVLELHLTRSDGEHRLSADDETGLFSATIGGMGLTGFITRVRLQLMRVGSLDVDEVLTPFDTLNDYFELAPEADAQNEYAVAWLDQLNGERGVLMTANHAKAGRAQTGNHRPMVGVPVNLPFNALNSWSLRAFNTAFRLSKMRHAGEEKRAPWQSYFYPLDAVGQWNRLYGPGGLFQHQSVIPFQTARDAIPALLQVSKKAGQASFLTVLKRFGDVVSPGLLSFPKPGYTLTLDFPNKGQSTLNLLDTLDRITMEAGGRVNPYKDARMSRSVFQKGFASWEELEAMRDPVIMSDFWRRVAN